MHDTSPRSPKDAVVQLVVGAAGGVPAGLAEQSPAEVIAWAAAAIVVLAVVRGVAANVRAFSAGAADAMAVVGRAAVFWLFRHDDPDAPRPRSRRRSPLAARLRQRMFHRRRRGGPAPFGHCRFSSS